jgi:hypothetical protein
MRKRIRRVAGVVLATALVAVAAPTTTQANERIIAKVPFAFVVHDSRLPPGEYVVKTLSDDPSVWVVASVDGRQSVLISTIAGSSSLTPAKPELVFERFDNQYFLARVVPGDDSEREIPLTPARMEHEIVKLALEP